MHANPLYAYSLQEQWAEIALLWHHLPHMGQKSFSEIGVKYSHNTVIIRVLKREKTERLYSPYQYPDCFFFKGQLYGAGLIDFIALCVTGAYFWKI